MRETVATSILSINAVFWLVMTIVSLALSADPLDPLILLMTGVVFMEAVLYAVCVYGIKVKSAPLYVFALFLSGGNAILSITDQIGVLDVVSLVLSLAAFVAVLSVRSRWVIKTKRPA